MMIKSMKMPNMSDEEKDANAKVEAALKDNDSSYDNDEDDEYFKNGETIPIDGKVYIKKVSANDKIRAQVKKVYSKSRMNTSKMLSLASDRSKRIIIPNSTALPNKGQVH
jgi:hypothetical protein